MAISDPAKLLQRLESEPRETTWLEFKVGNANPLEVAEYVSALANAAMLSDRDRAFIVFGLADGTRKRVGTKITLEKLKVGGEGFLNWLARVVKPQLSVEFIDFKLEGKSFVILAIEPTYDRPVSANGVEYIRIGEHKKRLADHPAEERALWYATGRRKFEDAVAVPHQDAAGINDYIDIDTFYDLREEERPRRTSEVMRSLTKAGVIKEDMEGGYDILNIGAILLARNLDRIPSLNGKSLRVVRYKGRDKRVSDFEEQINQGYAVAFRPWLSKIIRSLPAEERYIDGARRMVPSIPEIAIREVIANALIHQDFMSAGAGPVVEIFEDRVEVSNPGESLIETDRMLDERRSRNEKLASMMRDFRLCEERGGGLDKTVLTLESLRLPAPKFITSSYGMRVVLFSKRAFSQLSREDRRRSCFFHCVLRWMSHDYMSNSSLRGILGLVDEEYQAASAVISDCVRLGRIVPADPEQGRRNARYVPYWAR